MKKKITTLAPIETVNTSVHPKPTKAEVINALARVRGEEINKANKEARDRRAALHERIDAKLTDYVRKTIKEHEFDINFCSWKGIEAEVTVKLQALPEDVKTLRAQLSAIKVPSVPTENELRKQIRDAICESVGAEARVDAMVSDPSTRNALERMLTDLGISENSKAIKI